jgi:hypothetical protein
LVGIDKLSQPVDPPKRYALAGMADALYAIAVNPLAVNLSKLNAQIDVFDRSLKRTSHDLCMLLQIFNGEIARTDMLGNRDNEHIVICDDNLWNGSKAVLTSTLYDDVIIERQMKRRPIENAHFGSVPLQELSRHGRLLVLRTAVRSVEYAHDRWVAKDFLE